MTAGVDDLVEKETAGDADAVVKCGAWPQHRLEEVVTENVDGGRGIALPRHMKAEVSRCEEQKLRVDAPHVTVS